MLKRMQHDEAQIVKCPECGNEQADMGHGVECEECGFGPMPAKPVIRQRPRIRPKGGMPHA